MLKVKFCHNSKILQYKNVEDHLQQETISLVPLPRLVNALAIHERQCNKNSSHNGNEDYLTRCDFA